MEESRQAKEAGFWGREPAIKRDVPAYWSLATYGQPFHDERLAMGGATNVYQVGYWDNIDRSPHGIGGTELRS